MLYYLVNPHKALLGSVAVADAVAVPEAPRGSQRLSEAPSAPRGSQRVPEVPRGS